MCYILLRTWTDWWLNIRRHIKLALSPQHLKQEKGKSRETRGSSQLVKTGQKKHALLSVPCEEPPLLRVLALTVYNWKKLIVKPYICLPQKQTRYYLCDLCRTNCFAREAQEIAWDFCTWGWMNLQLYYRTVSKYKWFVRDNHRCCCKLSFQLNLAL